MKYNNLTKAQARGWAWNRICQRIKGSFNRKRARVYCLIGDTTHELEAAEAKGFSRLNVIGVDIKKESVEMWRKAGGLAIQAPIEAVLLFSKVRPQAAIIDFCGGLNEISFSTWKAGIFGVEFPGCVVMNLLRGRDKINKYRPDPTLEILKNDSKARSLCKSRPVILLSTLFTYLYEDELFGGGWNSVENVNEEKFSDRALEFVTNPSFIRKFKAKFDDFCLTINPQFYEYKSIDSGQWFDSIAINSGCLIPVDPSLGNSGIEDLQDEWKNSHSENEYKMIKRRLAALEAVRTQKLNAIPDRRRLIVESPSHEEIEQQKVFLKSAAGEHWC